MCERPHSSLHAATPEQPCNVTRSSVALRPTACLRTARPSCCFSPLQNKSLTPFSTLLDPFCYQDRPFTLFQLAEPTDTQPTAGLAPCIPACNLPPCVRTLAIMHRRPETDERQRWPQFAATDYCSCCCNLLQRLLTHVHSLPATTCCCISFACTPAGSTAGSSGARRFAAARGGGAVAAHTKLPQADHPSLLITPTAPLRPCCVLPRLPGSRESERHSQPATLARSCPPTPRPHHGRRRQQPTWPLRLPQHRQQRPQEAEVRPLASRPARPAARAAQHRG